MRVWLPLVQSDPRSATGIGFMYHRGLGVAVDDEKAAAWMRGAAEHGQAEGQLMLGSFYFYGQGVPQSYVRAYAWCALGEINGQSDATLCREAALQLMSNSEREQAFRMVVDLRERYELRR
jgi:TPR repeat protein